MIFYTVLKLFTLNKKNKIKKQPRKKAPRRVLTKMVPTHGLEPRTH